MIFPSPEGYLIRASVPKRTAVSRQTVNGSFCFIRMNNPICLRLLIPKDSLSIHVSVYVACGVSDSVETPDDQMSTKRVSLFTLDAERQPNSCHCILTSAMYVVCLQAAKPSTCKEQTALRLDVEADQEEIVDSTTSPCGDQTSPLQNGDDSVMINDCAVKLEATFDSNSFEAKDLTLGNEHRSLLDKEPALPNCPPSGHHDESPPLHPTQHQSERKTNDVSKKVCRALNEKLKRKQLNPPSASSAASRTLAEPTSTVQTYIDDSPRTSSPTATTMNKVTTFANIKQEGFLDQLHELPPPYEASTVPVIPMNAMTTCGPSSLSQTGPINTNIVQSSGQYFQVLQPMQTVEPLPSINNVYNYPTSNYAYPTSPSNGLTLETEKQNSPMLERYVQQQFAYNNQYQQYMTNGSENYGMKSPDSGYQEPCLSPSNGTLVSILKTYFFLDSDTTSLKRQGSKKQIFHVTLSCPYSGECPYSRYQVYRIQWP